MLISATGLRSCSYVDRRWGPPVPFTTDASFQHRLKASARPIFMPYAPVGIFTCAESPARKILPLGPIYFRDTQTLGRHVERTRISSIVISYLGPMLPRRVYTASLESMELMNSSEASGGRKRWVVQVSTSSWEMMAPVIPVAGLGKKMCQNWPWRWSRVRSRDLKWT